MDRESGSQLLQQRAHLTESLVASPYDLFLYLERALVYSELGYPDLAAGDAYRALLLTDEVLTDSFEYHEQAFEAVKKRLWLPMPSVMKFGGLEGEWYSAVPSDAQDEPASVERLATLASVRAYQMMSLCFLLCGCLGSAFSFCERGLKVSPANIELLQVKGYIHTVARQRLGKDVLDANTLPDTGLVRREVYPWNNHEPDRFSQESLKMLNDNLGEMAPKCEVRVSTLPVLLEGASETDAYDIIPTCEQLGVFAKEDLEPGETVLQEFSLLTANNRLKDPVCDACGSNLPPLNAEQAAVNCAECYDTVFCTQFCHDEAQRRYHPAVCDTGVDEIGKDPDAFEADETLYLLLLARVLAIAQHEEQNPLLLRDVRFIWGDFVPTATNDIDPSPNAGPPPEWTLPFSFKYNIETPLHILEKMDVDIYASVEKYDLWIFNTLYAKFRGTASARKGLRDGRPEVAAVHPYWCLANHDCDPNVTWEWGGRMVLSARKTRVVDGRRGGIRKDEEILNHYCDVNLPVQERREWAKGSLGGWCMCLRCRKEAAAQQGKVDTAGG